MKKFMPIIIIVLVIIASVFTPAMAQDECPTNLVNLNTPGIIWDFNTLSGRDTSAFVRLDGHLAQLAVNGEVVTADYAGDIMKRDDGCATLREAAAIADMLIEKAEGNGFDLEAALAPVAEATQTADPAQPVKLWVGNLQNAASSRTAFDLVRRAADNNHNCPADQIQEVTGMAEITVTTSVRLINVVICDDEGEVAAGFFGNYNGNNIVDQRWLAVCASSDLSCDYRYVYQDGAVRLATNATFLTFADTEPVGLRIDMEKWKPIFIRFR